MNSKRWITLLLVLCMLVSGIAPAAQAVSIAPESSTSGSDSNWFKDLIASAGEALGLPNLKNDQSHLKDNDYSLSLKDGKWSATTADGVTIPLTGAQLPEHIQVLQKAADHYHTMDMVAAFVVLGDAPTADTYGSILDVPADVTAELTAKQDDMLAAIENAVGSVEVITQFTHLTNAIVIHTAFGNLEPIAAIAGVKSVFLSPVYEPCKAQEVLRPNTVSSSNMTNASTVWKELGYSGEGMTIAILDTGLDQDHPSFAAAPAGAAWDVEWLQEALDKYDLRCEALYAKNTGTAPDAETLYYSAKVPFAFNYAMGTTNVSHNDGIGDHGTHVAGIAAANAVEGSGVVGMAPNAQIVAMKVFNSSTGGSNMYDLIAALEDCMMLGVDVVNMSLGSPAGFSLSQIDEIDAVFARVSESDMIVDVAAGNEGTSSYGSQYGTNMMPTQHIDNGTMSSPATYANSMAIASVDNKLVPADYIKLADGTDIFYAHSYEVMAEVTEITPQLLADTGDLEYVIIEGLGEEGDFYDAEGNSLVDGKIAVIRRGTLSFGTKIQNAEKAGAIAAIIWNNEETSFVMVTEYDDGSYPGIPALLVSLSDGQTMADAEVKTLTVPSDFAYQLDSNGGQVSSFSCWGVTPDLRLLPDLTGVGGNVYSCYDEGYYGIMSGTSMATPQVAGVTALVLQYLKEAFPNATEDEMRTLCDSIMMSTAVPVIDNATGLEASPRQQGAGLVDALNAVTAEAYLSVVGSARPKAELGDDAEGKYSFTFTIHNYSDSARTYTLRSSLLCEDYITDPAHPGMYFMAEADRALDNSAVTFSADTVTVAAGGTAEVNVTIELTEDDKTWIETYFPSGNYVEGFVYLESEDEVTLSLPFLGFYSQWDEAPLFDSGFWYEEGIWLADPAITGTQYHHLLWTSLGQSATEWMLGLNPYTGYVNYDEYGNIDSLKEYSSYNNVLSPNGDGVLDQITEFYISLMRNAEEMTFTYTNEAGEVLHSFLMEKESKTMYISAYGGVVPFVYSWYYSSYPLYDFSGVEDGDVVYLEIAGKIDYEGARENVMQTIPIHIDTSAAVLDTESIVETTNENGNFITLTFADEHPAAVITMNESGTQIYDYYSDEEMIDNGDGTWTVTVDVTGRGQRISVAICDYGCNEAFYDLTYTLTDNAPEMDKSALYAYQVYNKYIHGYYGWDSMFGWTTINKITADIEMLQSDAYEYYALNAAEYAGGYIFAVDAGGNFMYMEPGVWNRNMICNIGVNVVDMAWDAVSETMYVVITDDTTYQYGLYTLDLLTGELAEVRNYYDESLMPWAMTFVDGELYCCKLETAGFYKVNFEDNANLEEVTLEDGSAFVPMAANGEPVDPKYAQSMTYSAVDGKIYWAYYGNDSQCLITIDPATWESKAVSFYVDQEYVGLLTLEDDRYTLPASEAVTLMHISDEKVVMSSGKRYQLDVILLPWNAPITEEVVWASEDPSVATVDENGVVTSVSAGSTIVTASYGELSVSCEINVLDIEGTMHAYKYYDGNRDSYYWLDIDLSTVTEKATIETEFDFMAADYNGHDGMIYGFSDAGQCYRFDPKTGEYQALGAGSATMIPSDMAYDYSTGLMYAIIYDEDAWSTTLYTVNLSNGKLTEVASVGDILLTLACSTEGQLYAISTKGVLYELHIVDGEGGGIMPLNTATSKTIYANYVMQTPADSIYYAQTMCYDHNNDVLLWCCTEYGTIYCLAGLTDLEPYAVELGDPSGTGMIQYLGAYVVPNKIPKLPFTAISSLEADDMMMLVGSSKVPAYSVNPSNATYPILDVCYTLDESVAYYDETTDMLVAVGAGSTTVHVEVVDGGIDGIADANDSRYTAEFTVTVKKSTDNIYGYLMADLMNYDGYYFMNINDAKPSKYTGVSYVSNDGVYMTLYAAEYVDGKIYAYGYDDTDWEANFQYLTIDAKTWSVLSAVDMGDGFPFVYDMAFDYTTGTMFALAGSGSNATDLFYVDMTTGKLVQAMLTDPMFMSLAIDNNGTIYAMAASEEIDFDPNTGAGIYNTAKLYTLDVESGTCELFMDTGYKSNMLASMAYDHDTGYIYWTGLCSGSKYESGLYLIDPADKSCHSLGTIGSVGAQVTCLMVIADEYPEIETKLSNLALRETVKELAVGGSAKLETFASPVGAELTYTWKSSNKRVATVDEDGVVTGVSAGRATITVTATDGTNTLSASCDILVYDTNDYFITYNHTAGGFAKISRPDSSIVTQFTEAEDAAAVSAMAMVDGIIYAYDEEGNLFTTSEADGFVRNYIGYCGIEVAEPYEDHTVYSGSDSSYGYDYYYTPGFVIRDMAYDPVNNRLLVLGAQILGCYIEYWYESPSYSTRYEYADEVYELEGGCKIYTVDLETGMLEVLSTVGGEEDPMSGVTMLTVTDDGQAYTYSYYLDFVMKLDLETGLYQNLSTFQNMGVKGSDDNDLMAMVYDAGTNSLVMLFTTNGNAHSLYKFDLGTLGISFMGYVGDVVINYGYAYGDYFGGLVINVPTETPNALGDVNGDGLVNTTDAKLIMQYELGLVDETALDLAAADVNGDGVVNTTDAKLVMQLELGLIDAFPNGN